uniref:Uncharacterized protein n=1 Tax=Parascaris equorum TaxID=6256 RepID=A0A914RFR2_PAREQ
MLGKTSFTTLPGLWVAKLTRGTFDGNMDTTEIIRWVIRDSSCNWPKRLYWNGERIVEEFFRVVNHKTSFLEGKWRDVSEKSAP